MQLTPDLPVGAPSFQLSDDEIATVIDLVCRACAEARVDVTAGMWEVPITVIVRKAMRRVKKALSIGNLEIRGEHEIDNMAASDPSILGRIDITLKCLRQFGDEDDYVAIECKRIGAGLHQLNERYVSQGVVRFVNGKYAVGHGHGFMLGYVLAVPIEKPLKSIDGHLRKSYGHDAKLVHDVNHAQSLAQASNALTQEGGHVIQLHHILVDMTVAA